MTGPTPLNCGSRGDPRAHPRGPARQGPRVTGVQSRGPFSWSENSSESITCSGSRLPGPHRLWWRSQEGSPFSGTARWAPRPWKSPWRRGCPSRAPDLVFREYLENDEGKKFQTLVDCRSREGLSKEPTPVPEGGRARELRPVKGAPFSAHNSRAPRSIFSKL